MNCIIIDDDDLSRKLIEQFISKTGFLTVSGSFESPVRALSFLSCNKVDLIFLDMEMPEMSGLEFIDTIKQQTAQVILITSHKEFAVDAFEYNVTDYVVKPIEYSRFFKAVTKAKDIFDKETGHQVND